MRKKEKSAPEDLRIPLSIPHVRTAVLPQGFAHSALTYLPVVAKAMAQKTGTTRNSAEQPAEPPGGAAQPASLPLCELNKRSAQFGTWAVIVQQAQVFEECS